MKYLSDKIKETILGQITKVANNPNGEKDNGISNIVDRLKETGHDEMAENLQRTIESIKKHGSPEKALEAKLQEIAEGTTLDDCDCEDCDAEDCANRAKPPKRSLLN